MLLLSLLICQGRQAKCVQVPIHLLDSVRDSWIGSLRTYGLQFLNKVKSTGALITALLQRCMHIIELWLPAPLLRAIRNDQHRWVLLESLSARFLICDVFLIVLRHCIPYLFV